LPPGSTTSLPPTQAFELQEGRGAVTDPLRLIAKGEAGILFLLSLPPVHHLPNTFFHLTPSQK